MPFLRFSKSAFLLCLLLLFAFCLEAAFAADLENDCSEYLTTLNGTIASPNYPNDYPNNAACSWEIATFEGLRVRLVFQEFHLENSQDCTKDYVDVYDGAEYHVFCGRQMPPVIESVGNRMAVAFASDGEIQFGHRFFATYDSIPSISTPDPSFYYCGDNVDLGNTSAWFLFSSPFHPSPYPERTSCSWVLTNSQFDDDYDPSASKRTVQKVARETRLAFLRFDLDETLEDYVRVSQDGGFVGQYQGNLQCDKGDHKLGTPTSRGFASETIVEFHSRGPESSERSTGLLFFSTGALKTNEMHVRTARNGRFGSKRKGKPAVESPSQIKPEIVVQFDFVSGVMTSNNEDHSAFAGFLDLENIAKEKKGEIGFISSPGHPNPYPPKTSMIVNITTSDDQRLAVYFARFATEPKYDRVWIEDMNSGWILQLDGMPDYVYDQVHLSDSNWVQISFYSDETDQNTGFLAAIASVDVTGPCQASYEEDRYFYDLLFNNEY